MYKVGVLTLDGFALMSYASLVEPFRAANLLSNRLLYEVNILTERKEGAMSSSGIKLEPKFVLGDFPALDLLFVVAGGDPFQYENKTLYAWLNKFDRHGIMIGGISGGPIILAKAGLMNNYRMTVHWEHASGLKEGFPELRVEKSLFVVDRRRISCAGGTAPIDMVLALITANQGMTFAQLVSDWFMHNEMRPPGGSQRSAITNRFGTTNRSALDAIELMEKNLSDPLTLNDLSEASSISSRQLNRIFKKSFRNGTMNYYRKLRLDKARNFLRNSEMSIVEISVATGFSSASHFSTSFKQEYDEAPTNYRKNSRVYFENNG